MGRVTHRLDLAGQRFGRWLVLGKSHSGNRGQIFWHCRCDCGTERPVTASGLRSGISTSCGCYHREAVTSHGMTKTRTWKSWDSMLQRCENPKAPDFARYGGRGITVCHEWHDFNSFLADMGERPDGTTIERNDVNGRYEPDNCRWATGSEQQRNRTVSIRMTLNGVTKSIHDWADEYGIPAMNLIWRIRKGWSPLDAVSTPIRPKRPSRKGP